MPTGVYKRTEYHIGINRISHTGKKHTEEHKNKIRLSNMGHIVSIDTREKIRKANIGKMHSEETKIKLREFNLGKKLSEDTKKKIGIASLGNKGGGWCKGMKLSDETKRKMSEAQRGEKGSNWKGGLSSVKNKIRKCYKYSEWRKSVFERDDYTCKECKQRGGELNADHIKPFSTIIIENNITKIDDAYMCSELWDIKNGNTLCEKCHRKTPTFGGRKK